MDFSNWKNLTGEQQQAALAGANQRLASLQESQWKAQNARQQAAVQKQYETERAAATRPWWQKLVTGAYDTMLKPVNQSLISLFGGGGASVRDLLTGNAGTQKYQNEFRNFERGLYDAKDNKELAAKRLGAGLNTAAMVVPAGGAARAATLGGKALRMGVSGFGSGALFGAGDAIAQQKSLPEVLGSAAQTGFLGGAIGGAFPYVGRTISGAAKSKIGQGAGKLMFGTTPRKTTTSAVALLGANAIGNRMTQSSVGDVDNYYGVGQRPQVAYQMQTQAPAAWNNPYSQYDLSGLSDEDLYQLVYGGY